MQEIHKKPLMVLLMNKRVSIFARTYCFLVFFNEEIVLACLNKETERDLVRKWQDDNKDNEYALSEKDFRKFLSQYVQKYYEMSAEDILNEDKRNFILSYLDIKHICFKASKKSNSFLAEEVGSLTIQTAGKKFKFTHHYRDWNRNICTVLSDLYGNRIKYTEGDRALSSVFKEGREGFY